MLIETHAHLDYPDFAADFEAVLPRATEAGITRIITIGTSIESSRHVCPCSLAAGRSSPRPAGLRSGALCAGAHTRRPWAREEALREGRRAVALLRIARDTMSGPLMIEFFAIICAWTGERDLALRQLAVATQLASCFLSYGQLKLHPFWDPLRGGPRFEKIVASLVPQDAH